MTPLPAAARIVIIGAGAIGTSIAWQLAREGERDIVVIDKAQITHGSTWHAAGLVGQYRSRADLTRLMRSSVDILNGIQAETPIDWRPVGSLRIASSQARWRELRDAAAKARDFGVGFELIDATEARRLFPYLATDGVVGAAWVAGDGYVDPSSVTQAYAARARQSGVRFVENVLVTAFERRGDRVAAVLTDAGRIDCEIVALAAGVWARPIARRMGIDAPVAALEHQYAVTAKRGGMPGNLPALRDPDLNFYLKPEVGGFAIGGWEPDTWPAAAGEMAFEFGRELLPDQIERLAPILEAAARRVPAVGELGLRTVINGPIPVTPDGEPIVGPAPGVANVFLAIGFTSGIAASGGAGRALAQWIVHGGPDFALPSLDPRRFGATPVDLEALNARAIDAYGAYYALSERRDRGLEAAGAVIIPS